MKAQFSFARYLEGTSNELINVGKVGMLLSGGGGVLDVDWEGN